MEQLTTTQIEEWAQLLLEKCNEELTPAEKREQLKYATLIRNPKDKIFLSKLLDESSQIRDQKKLAQRIKVLIDRYGVPEFFNTGDSFLLNAYKWIGYKFDFVAVPIFKKRLRLDTEAVIIHEERPMLTSHLKTRAAQKIGQNINLLGEVVLGDGEARHRYEHYMAALKEPDINYISIKLSGIYAQLHPLNFVRSRCELADLLATIYQAAIDNPYVDEEGQRHAKFINLDMEEYKDAHLTMELFIEVLSRPQFRDYTAGIVIQAYLPDAYHLQSQLLDFAIRRVEEGGAPLKMRLVKGANLEMESVISSLRGWENPIRGSKVEVDANYLHIIDRAFEPENARAVHVGIASHNLFTIGYAFLKAQQMGVEEFVTFEMLEGMANQLWRALSSFGKQIILYTPVVKDEHFLNAISYLVRRLDENTGPENFLSYSFGLKADSSEWEFLKKQFEQAYAMKDSVRAIPSRTQNRITEQHDRIFETFENEPDTNFDLAANRRWAQDIVAKWSARSAEIIPLQIGQEQTVTEKRVRYEDRCQKGYVPYEMSMACKAEVVEILATANESSLWRETTIAERISVLHRAANLLAKHRGDLIGAMAAVTGKTVTEGDVEVSEAIDFCRFYPLTMRDLMSEPGVRIRPKGTILVISPWNFPLAIPVGGVVAALSGGNSVIIKPATVAAPVMWEACKLLWEAGVPKEALQIVITDSRESLRELTTAQSVKHIVLTGGTDTAQRIATDSPCVALSAETGGKNVIILTSKGDRDKAIMNTVASAFGNAGQKCSACSLMLVERDVFEDETFKSKFIDAANSMNTGSPWDLTNVVGPMITNNNEKLNHVIDHKESYTEWLVPPVFVDDARYTLRPTILWGVEPSSYAFHTELFAPLLAVGVIDSLEEGIEFVNSLEYGLTSGLQSLDESEIALWRDSVEAGNLYINRGITGAVVNRQPFGGMKLSAFGGGIKAGGVNYVSCFVDIEDDGTIKSDNYREVYKREFHTPRDVNNLYGEQNLFRYLPLSKMALRLFPGDDFEDVRLIARAAITTKTPLIISISEDDPNFEKVSELGCEVLGQSLERFIRDIANYSRIRSCSPNIPKALYDAAAVCNKYIATAPVVRQGRFELLHYLKEQSISYEYHRYGSITEKPIL